MCQSLLDDAREIAEVYNPKNEYTYQVGFLGISRIEIYSENGQCGYVPWVAVWFEDEDEPRVKFDAAGCTVTYND
jgi:hypothetical protein